MATLIVAAVLVMQGCNEKTTLVAPSGIALDVRKPTGPISGTDSLAQRVALALSDPVVRQMLFEDLRDATVLEHRLHLRSYIRGERGARVVTSAASATGKSTQSILAAEALLPELELFLPRPLDRVRWSGTSDVVVIGAADGIREKSKSHSYVGYTTEGVAVPVDGLAAVPYPVIVVAPVSVAFGSDPEGARAIAPRKTRATVSTAAEELRRERTARGRLGRAPLPRNASAESYRAFAAFAVNSGTPQYLLSCDPENDPYCCENMDECEGEPSPGVEPGGIELSSQYTPGNCGGSTLTLNSTNDQDHDGLWDECENQLAEVFNPTLVYSNYEQAPDREPYFSVKRAPNAAHGFEVHIFYALGYTRDDGCPLIACNVLGVGDPHWGDSEFIILYLHPAAGNSVWQLREARLSAHWNAVDEGYSGFYWFDDLEYPAEYRGRPRIWVSEGKHANYRSQSVCEGMWWGLGPDVCSRNGTVTRVSWPAGSAFIGTANIGNSPNAGFGAVTLKDCVTSRLGLPGTECFWNVSSGYFAGWKGITTQTTPYRIMLNHYFF